MTQPGALARCSHANLHFLASRITTVNVSCRNPPVSAILLHCISHTRKTPVISVTFSKLRDPAAGHCPHTHLENHSSGKRANSPTSLELPAFPRCIQRLRRTEIFFHFIIHCLSACNSRGGARQDPGTTDSISDSFKSINK